VRKLVEAKRPYERPSGRSISSEVLTQHKKFASRISYILLDKSQKEAIFKADKF
jgi:hypothetical protein